MRLYLSSFRLGNHPEKFVHLLRGKRKVAVIVNAMDFLDADQRKVNLQQELERLETLDLDFTEIDLRNFFDKSDELHAELSTYDALWMRGGNCFILRRALRQSGADEIITDLLANDQIVYGGYSAGIDMLVPSLHGVELVDPPNIIPNGYKSEIIWDGLNILPYAVAPHYKSDHPESADINKSISYMIDNHIPFVALRDGEAIIIYDSGSRIIA